MKLGEQLHVIYIPDAIKLHFELRLLYQSTMTSSNDNIFRVTGPLWGESTGHRWIPLTKKASDAELWCFLWSAPEQTVEKTIETPVIWDAIALIMTSLQWDDFDSLRPGGAYKCQKTGSSLVQVIACRFLVSIHCLDQCWLVVGSSGTDSSEILFKIRTFSFKKMHVKM